MSSVREEDNSPSKVRPKSIVTCHACGRQDPSNGHPIECLTASISNTQAEDAFSTICPQRPPPEEYSRTGLIHLAQPPEFRYNGPPESCSGPVPGQSRYADLTSTSHRQPVNLGHCQPSTFEKLRLEIFSKSSLPSRHRHRDCPIQSV